MEALHIYEYTVNTERLRWTNNSENDNDHKKRINESCYVMSKKANIVLNSNINESKKLRSKGQFDMSIHVHAIRIKLKKKMVELK